MKKLDKRLLAAILSAVLVIVGFTIAKGAETGGWTVKVDRINFTTDEGYEMSAKMYQPENATPETPAPGILAIPGGNASLENMSDVAI